MYQHGAYEWNVNEIQGRESPNAKSLLYWNKDHFYISIDTNLNLFFLTLFERKQL